MSITTEKKGQLEFINIAKGIGILMVVWAHAKGPFTDYMYQFHMPLFFLISGYLFNSRNTPGQFVLKKIKSLYIPFAFWNVFFVVMRSVFHIEEYKGVFFWEKILKIILTLDKDGQFLGATWFLGALFTVSICYKLMDYYLPAVRNKSVFLAILFGAAAVLGFSVTLPYMLSRTLILSFFFAVGRVVREYKDQFSVFDTKLVFLFSVIMFGVIGHYNSVNMGGNKYNYRLLFVIGALFASYGTIYISRVLEKKTVWIKRVLSIMGAKSLPIVIWQFVVFRIVTVIQLRMDQIPVDRMMDYYPPYKTTEGWWILYTIVGIIVSVIIGEITSVIVRSVARRK